MRLTLEQLVGASWAPALASVEPTIRRIGDVLRDEQVQGRRFLPPSDRIFAAFSTPLEDVRVLLVGQDPYPTRGHAVGLSFSVAPDVAPLPPSLVNIFREYGDDLGLPTPSTGDLSPWAANGVLLLNRCLTVREGTPASHRGIGWEDVTDAAIDALVARDQPFVAILWGRDARNLAPRLGDIPRIESAHPSPLSAHRGFFGSRPFSRANAALAGAGIEPVNFRLP